MLGGMSPVHLSGHLRCKNSAEADLVAQYLPKHIELTLAEPGCVSFEVTPTESPLVWRVEEHFADSDAFRTHQARVVASEWGTMTSEIARDYTVTGLTE